MAMTFLSLYSVVLRSVIIFSSSHPNHNSRSRYIHFLRILFILMYSYSLPKQPLTTAYNRLQPYFVEVEIAFEATGTNRGYKAAFFTIASTCIVINPTSAAAGTKYSTKVFFKYSTWHYVTLLFTPVYSCLLLFTVTLFIFVYGILIRLFYYSHLFVLVLRTGED
jgi:hypothetical protein